MSTFKIALLWTLTGVAAAAPVLHHTDLDSGPPGAYVTVWGANFPSTPSLTAGGINVAAVSSSVGATGDTVLTFRIPANANSSGIIVNGSNTLPFVVRPGRIFYISTATGSNANDGLSDANVALGRGPWQDLSKITAMLPGDIVYLRGGTYTKILNTTYNANIHITKTASGLPGKPKAMVAYPGEIPVIGNGMNSR
ncbi:MAG: hypothetical protein ACREXR_16345, partial [Gammaproteobacteria bacterium]